MWANLPIRMWNSTIGAALPPASHAGWLRWLLTMFGFWLLAVTWPLWLRFTLFPQVPWFRWGCGVPWEVDVGLFLIVCGTLMGIAVTAADSRLNRISLLLFAGAWLGLLLLDQHRCQPWAYQWLLISLILACAPHQLAIKLLRILLIGIYIHSAISKCDISFCEGLGKQFLDSMLNVVGWRQGPFAKVPRWWPLAFPLGEFVVAAGLIWPRTRRISLWLATGMHLLLIAILGWGLQHSWAVLVWNLFFIALNWTLFSGRPLGDVTPTEPLTSRKGILSKVAIALTVWVTFWPFLEPWGYCDLWPAWGLYAQHGEHLQIRMSRLAVAKSPLLLNETIDDVAGSDWQSIPVQRIALRQTKAPVYPQNRYLLGVALAFARDAHLSPDQIAITWYPPANRWTGVSQAIELQNLQEIEAAADRCWFNAYPRK